MQRHGEFLHHRVNINTCINKQMLPDNEGHLVVGSLLVHGGTDPYLIEGWVNSNPAYLTYPEFVWMRQRNGKWARYNFSVPS